MNPSIRSHKTPSLMRACTDGFWFCRKCERVTEVQENYLGCHACSYCGRPARFYPAVLIGPHFRANN